jgi:hypothetical protein
VIAIVCALGYLGSKKTRTRRIAVAGAPNEACARLI